MKIYWKLFSAFFRIGLFTFGGGYAMLPMLEREVVDRHGWATRDDLLDYFAISQTMPGIIAVNTATMVGYLQKKVRGAACAAAGVVAPSFIIISIIAAVLQNFMHIEAVGHAFAGIRVAVCALIIAAVIKLFKGNVLPKKAELEGADGKARAVAFAVPLALFAASFAVVALAGLNPGWVILGAAVCGLLFYGRKKEDTP